MYGTWTVSVLLTLGTRGFVGRSHERRAGHYKDLTETGNRARKVSGTQGTFSSVERKNKLGDRRIKQLLNLDQALASAFGK